MSTPQTAAPGDSPPTPGAAPTPAGGATQGKATPPAGNLRIIGLDLSLTSTGIAGRGWTDRVRPPGSAGGLHGALSRMRDIRDTVLGYARGADLVVIEGLAYSRTTGKATERAGLWWMVMEALAARDVPVAVVTPTARARYATGRGNAGKDEVLAAVIRRYPAYLVRGNDEADALVLAAMGYDHVGQPLVQLRGQLPAAHRAALTGVAWPEVAW